MSIPTHHRKTPHGTHLVCVYEGLGDYRGMQLLKRHRYPLLCPLTQKDVLRTSTLENFTRRLDFCHRLEHSHRKRNLCVELENRFQSATEQVNGRSDLSLLVLLSCAQHAVTSPRMIKIPCPLLEKGKITVADINSRFYTTLNTRINAKTVYRYTGHEKSRFSAKRCRKINIKPMGGEEGSLCVSERKREIN